VIVICATATAERFHGFPRSIMLNPHPGVYVSRDVDRAARERIWTILSSWHDADPRGMVVMIRPDKNRPMGVAITSLRAPKREIVEIESHYAIPRQEALETLPNDDPKILD
jgi:CRISPR-associated protein Cas2